MGAWKIDVMLHDDQVEQFIAHALATYERDGNVSDWEFAMRDLTRYIAERFIDVVPELDQFRPHEHDTPTRQ